MKDIINIEEIFGENAFTLGKMRERLPKDVFEEVVRVADFGGELSKKTADIVANEMKDWAIEKGATHYTHWFQPLTGTTAEKHDSFITHPDSEGRMIMEFSGKELIKGESDASSFPSGGLRATFEARGYTAWDITSPAFLKEDATGTILCIPTAFCSYKGEALDKKTPLLRSMQAINEQALRVVRLFGNKDAKKVIASVGAEQEYFLVDRDMYLRRTDLIYTGRTLIGCPAAKGQEMDDHYYGCIRERIGSFMKDVNVELWKIGVTAKTQHNEVAPAQHELAPIYETANVATDHNQLVMETMKKVAERHNLACLLHEKPFKGINGSGKHNNWSLNTDNGMNLLDPGDTPNENIQFLFVLACIMKAVDTHADLLRQSASDVGNDYRLGADEAPPAIISMFLGEQLDDVVKQLVETGEATHCIGNNHLETGVSSLPDLLIDPTDRNRTSPFAFTGNKFEFRMVGSADSIGDPNVILNTIVAESFCEACDRIEKADNFDEAVHDIIKEYVTKHERIVFNGNNYAPEWIEEAKRRGLPNLPTMLDAVDTLTTEKSIKLFEKFNIFTKAELESRKEILYETYSKTINIEANCLREMIKRQILPAEISYMDELAGAYNKGKAAGVEIKTAKALLEKVNGYCDGLSESIEKLEENIKEARSIKNNKEKAFAYRDKVKAAMEEVRYYSDELERITDKDFWPIPSYGDLLFEV
ncbi:MAG: glutamine synthetase III [Lachnospiraceae bacterium]|nr:glutamine synthetase III [Lachnospiraceae bacterium]